MSTTKVYAPNVAFTGDVGGVMFQDGVGTLDPVASPSALRYFERHGYGIGKPPPALEPLESIDARNHATSELVGSPLRDAAVDPRPEDFLPPINAGKADPHGPLVVAPGIHGVGPKPIRPGVVHVEDVDQQAADETELARRVLIEGEPATIVSSDELPGGPLGLSDPGSVEVGVRGAAALVAPAKSARVADWRDFAVARGMAPEDAASLSRDVLIERFGA